jgi:hypothetical protein
MVFVAAENRDIASRCLESFAIYAKNSLALYDKDDLVTVVKMGVL